MSIADKRIAILVEQQYQEMELWYPLYRLKEAGAEVTLIGPKLQSYPSKLGYPAKADKAVDDVSADDFDGIVIPGGFCPDYLRRSPKIIALVAAIAEAGKPTAAICHGPWVLCSTEVLKGKRVTSFGSIRDDLTNAGAIWEDAETVIDGNILTSRTPEDLPAFMAAFLKMLG